LTGNIGSKQESEVSISPGFRSGLFVYLGIKMSESQTKSLYELGSNSYFAESAYIMDNPSDRYWGSNYAKLQTVKFKYDPNQTFSCYHCVNRTSNAFALGAAALSLSLLSIATTLI
jgi:hypothetical protein